MINTRRLDKQMNFVDVGIWIWSLGALDTPLDTLDSACYYVWGIYKCNNIPYFSPMINPFSHYFPHFEQAESRQTTLNDLNWLMLIIFMIITGIIGIIMI